VTVGVARLALKQPEHGSHQALIADRVIEPDLPFLLHRRCREGDVGRIIADILGRFNDHGGLRIDRRRNASAP